MSQEEDDKRKSVSLSEVLGEIGVNEHTVRIRRKCTLLKESITTFSLVFIEKNIEFYCFGSQSEGTTTPGLKSDADVLTVLRNYHVIQNLSDWKPGISDLMLMIQDETTSPGYCLLQLLRKDTPQPAEDLPSSDYKTDDKGRILFRNSAFRPCEIGCEYNGPANTFPELPGRCSIDGVPAFYCESWPVEARGWLERKCVGDWPSESMKRLAVSKGCFLVPVDSKCNPMTADVEWRISTSMAERIMMFDLNMTQIHTYVVLKCICKTFFTMDDKSLISSFMCKCTLLYCVENTPRSFWQVGMLYPCVITCLCELRKRVLDLNCPHYIIPTNNLMANRINGVEQQHLLLVIDTLIQQNVDMFMFIEIDDFGERLFVKMNKMSMHLATRESSIVGSELLNLSAQESNVMCQSLREIEGLDNVITSLLDGEEKLQKQRHTLDDIQTEAMAHIYPHVCTWIGSTLAASSVKANNTVSPEAIRWFSAGQNIDVASSRLKLVAAFYCAGDITNAELTLQDIERRYTLLVAPLCRCIPQEREPLPNEWYERLYQNNDLLPEMVSNCVKFLKCEEPIIPNELRPELFRSTKQDIRNRSFLDSLWMDFAVVDSLPFFYFMQYKVYKHQGRQEELKRALKLLQTTINEACLYHRETALNILGQCLEQDNMPLDAITCYETSLKVRPRNNAAIFHVARLHEKHSREQSSQKASSPSDGTKSWVFSYCTII